MQRERGKEGRKDQATANSEKEEKEDPSLNTNWQSTTNLDYQRAWTILKEARCKCRDIYVFQTVSIHSDRQVACWRKAWKTMSVVNSLCLALRFCRFLLVVVFWCGSTFVIRFGFWFIAGPLLLAGFLFTSAALLLGPLPIAVAPLTIVRLVLAAPLPIFILGFFQGILGLGRSRLGFGTRTPRPGRRTLASWTWTTATTRWPLLPFLWSRWWSTWPSSKILKN